MAHHRIIKADKHIITTTKELYCSTFLSPQYVCNCSIRILGKPENNQEKKKKKQNNVKTFIVASNWINTHVYMNCLIGENFVTFIQIKYQERQRVLNTFAPSRENSETLTWEKSFLKWRQLFKHQWPTKEKLLPSNAAGGMVQPVIFCAGSMRKHNMELWNH